MHPWLSARSTAFDSSGIRKVFDLAAKMKDPINLSIGQPDFPRDSSPGARGCGGSNGRISSSSTDGIDSNNTQLVINCFRIITEYQFR